MYRVGTQSGGVMNFLAIAIQKILFFIMMTFSSKKISGCVPDMKTYFERLISIYHGAFRF